MRTWMSWPIAAMVMAPVIVVAPPASAVPPVTAAEMISAIEQAQATGRAVVLGAGGQLSCSTSAGPTTTGVVRPTGFSLTSVENGVSTMFVAGTKKHLTVPLQYVKGLTNKDASFIAAVLADAKAPADTRYVKGPWGASTTRYLGLPADQAPDFASLAALRNFGVSMMFDVLPQWLSDAGVTYTKIPSPDGSVLWRAGRSTSATGSEEFTFIVSPEGRPGQRQKRLLSNGVVTYESTCTWSNYGSPGPLTLPPEAQTAPILKVGPSAWRLTWTAALGEITETIKQKVVADQDLTVKAVRAKSYVVVYGAGLQNDITISNVPGGARLAVSDPIAGTLARCVTLKNGTLKDAAC